MERVEKQEVITLDDGKEFFVVDIIEDNGNRYLYLARDGETLEVMLAKEVIENNEIIIETITNNDEKKTIMAKFLKNLEQ